MRRLMIICVATIAILITTNQAQATIRNVPSITYPTIQSSIDAAVNGDLVIVADGIYTGAGNRDIDFLGKAITVCSENGPENCIIDCQGSAGNEHRGFLFHSSEGENSILSGFTIRNGQAGNGAGIGCYYASPTITNCTISNNKAGGWGGGIDCRDCSPTITDCTISGNAASVAPSSATGGGGINCIDSNPTIIDCTIINNTSTTGGGIGCMRSSPTIINCAIINNSSTHSDGGVGCYWYSSPSIINCIVNLNKTVYWGGGLRCSSFSAPIITNCTFIGNSTNLHGGGIFNETDSLMLTNCILWGNSDSEGIDESAQIYGGTPIINYSCIPGWTGALGGISNFGYDPLFADADGRLSLGSPCIDAGDNSLVFVATDYDGNPRIVNNNVDMGAFEANSSAILITMVIDLDLPDGITNSLLAKLNSAQKANDSVAINLLQAFINAVKAQRGTQISEVDADSLISAAQAIITML